MEYLDKFQFLFIAMFVVGFGLPLVNVILGALSAAADTDVDVDLDAETDFDLDIDLDLDTDIDVDLDLDLDIDVDIPDTDADPGDFTDLQPKAGGGGSIIKFNMNCLCLAMVVFSAVSYYRIQFVGNTMQLAAVLVVDALVALGAYFLLYYFVVRKLKTNDASALKSGSLLHKRGVVTVPIMEDKIGEIQLNDALGATITYLAKIDQDICSEARISTGTQVLITEFDGKSRICRVTVSHRQQTMNQ